MVDIRYLKTNFYFLGVLFVILCVLLFFLLRYFYPNKINRNVPITVFIALVLVIGLYYIPIKLPKMKGDFDDKLIIDKSNNNYQGDFV